MPDRRQNLRLPEFAGRSDRLNEFRKVFRQVLARQKEVDGYPPEPLVLVIFLDYA